MQIYEYKCKACKYKESFIKPLKRWNDTTVCPKCFGTMFKIPSTTGYRRGHTILEGDDR